MIMLRLSIGIIMCGVIAGCGQAPRSISSASPPKSNIISYPNSYDRVGTTVVLSDPSLAVAGVNGRVMTISDYEHQQVAKHLVTIDVNGNLGLSGSVNSMSSRAEKYDIQPYRENATKLIQRVHVVSYHYRGEKTNEDRHVGFIAEDTPATLSGSQHNGMNMNNTVAVELAATQQLERQLHEMQARIHQLEQQVSQLQARSGTRAGSH